MDSFHNEYSIFTIIIDIKLSGYVILMILSTDSEWNAENELCC